MNFSDLTFVDHPIRLAGEQVHACTQAIETFPNGWQVSVIAGPAGCGMHGTIGQDTFEVAVSAPPFGMIGDPLPWQTPAQITSILRMIEQMPARLPNLMV